MKIARTNINLMKYFGLICFLVVFAFPQSTTAQSFEGYSWETLETNGKPVARHEAAFIEVDNKFYLMGGRRIQEVSIFNPKTNTWTSGAKPPIEIHHFQGVSYKGNIYAIGAHTGKYPHETPLKEAYIYNPKKDSWAKGFKMPEERVRASTTANIYKDKLYIACGIIDGHWDGHVKWFDVYDFKTGKWAKLPDAPRARDHATSVICNDKLYLLGGRISSGNIKKVFELTIPEVDVYDFKTGKWSTMDKPVPTQRAGCTSICIGNKILFTGGESITQPLAHNEVECLDTKTGDWSTLPSLITGRHGTQLIWNKKQLYIASGCGRKGGNPELTTIEKFSK
ncbi:Kelch repeat-containing protein [Algibacter sp. L1A34]|uniref:Kelch repeat-containing protein n=1 Tax=Algibacter sp. L1A34 TaxID=2686365 RepID=UPI001E3717AD|nr:kelch-like protein [Algibacter sp. L1A34]